VPSLPLRPCAQVGCKMLVNRGRCAQHQLPPRQEKAIARPYDTRGTYAYRPNGPGVGWKAIRNKILKANPFCPCGARSTEVDHVIARSRGGTDDSSNLLAMCHSCHSRKTAKYDGAFRSKREKGR
jgi:5-methylcytosine-specific restriction protein A